MRSEIRAQQKAEQRRRRIVVVGPMLGLFLIVGGFLALWSMGESGRDRVVLSSVEPERSGANPSTSSGPGAAEPWFVPATPGTATTTSATATSTTQVPSGTATSPSPAGAGAGPTSSSASSTSPSSSSSTTTKRKGPPKPPGPPTTKDR